MIITMLFCFVALTLASAVAIYRTKADVIIALSVLAIAIASAIIGITATELKQTNKTKKMTINYEFRDSVYIPVDTVINNN